MPHEVGQNWLLLRGLARESAHWGDFVPLLQATFPAAKITQLDLPGTGQFYKDTSPNTLQAITDTVRSHALVNGALQQPATLLAISLGAMVAWDWLQRYPDDICAASLINPSFASLSPFYQRLRWQCYPKLIALLLQRNMRRRETAILQLVSNRRDQDELISAEWGRIQKLRPISLNNSLRQIIAAAHYRPDGLKPKAPVLLLNGKGDRLVSPQCTAAIQQKWHLEGRCHPWAGHDLTLDDGAWAALQLKDWVLGVSYTTNGQVFGFL
jgi:pimeloyl-ACP methyl ester carboxylesterase